MTPKATGNKSLRYHQTADSMRAFASSYSPRLGFALGVALLAVVGAFLWRAISEPHGIGLVSGLGGALVTLLFFGFVPLVLLRRQRITLDGAGLESRFFVLGVPVWRDFLPLGDIVGLESAWDGGSDEGACERLLIRTTRKEIQWGVDADNAAIEELAKRLHTRWKQLRPAPSREPRPATKPKSTKPQHS